MGRVLDKPLYQLSKLRRRKCVRGAAMLDDPTFGPTDIVFDG